MTGLVSGALEFVRQLPHALTGPPQRRLRVTASHRFHQRFQITLESRVLVNGSLSPRSFSADSLPACWLRRSLEFPQPTDHGPSGQATGLSHRGDSAETNDL